MSVIVQPAPIDKVRALKPLLTKKLRRIRNVNGIGISRLGEGFCFKVNLKTRTAIENGSIPADFMGVPVLAEVIGPIRARTKTKR